MLEVNSLVGGAHVHIRAANTAVAANRGRVLVITEGKKSDLGQ